MTENSAPAQHPHGHNPNPDPGLYRTQPVSFVRRGARLNPGRQAAWDRMSPHVVLKVPRDRADTSVAPNSHLQLEQVYGRTAPLVVDIGCGQGESTLAGAQARPEANFLAVEVYTPGVAALLLGMETHELENIRAVQANAPEVLDHLLPEASADEIWIFFPDPWHKARHHKRRLVSPTLVPKLERVLRDGGTLRLATDWEDYAWQMREVLDDAAALRNVHDGFAPRFDTRPLTSFENKAHRAGREIFDLTYTRAPR
ncbi:tRNA (guanosine(46)-N7)-methyltransferase TrmB [Citricoccus muralis]|uniref:tRNA (guanine-N(7)-)-methyltransferase n=1 Tax=Citricoccus muralis TaxID=169134 RepID=A0ABY8H5P7_9MICC|nr:tRNA (guanosine(46)-N7)-methyltransferase TrmB [Citricoccus muralis]WFP16045.1 tRNA (guanosine(46)-N7)-methyltransferase TrmB [Citricoccus muralis]